VPQKTKELSSKVEKLAKLVVKKGNKNAYSDAKSALHLAKVAQALADENIKINEKTIANL
jgi:formiminotetrahydrofolate cyclodeaminase